jgi:cytochrome c-type biogenesis protein CcmF
LAVMLLFLMGVGPIVAWRRATIAKLAATFAAPVGFGVAAGAVVFALGMRSLSAITVTSLSAFVLQTIFHEFHRGARARTAMTGEAYFHALRNLVAKNRRRYGGYIIHLGVVFMFIGVTMSSVYRVEELHTVKPGESFTVGDFTLEYRGVTDLSDDHVARMAADLSVSRDGRHVATLAPEKRFYRRPEQPATEVDYRSTLTEDLYVILGSVGEDQRTATFQVYVNPLVIWLWIGGVVLILGTGICVFPGGRRATEGARAAAPMRRTGDAA